MAIKRRAQMIEIAAIAAPLALVGMTRVAMTPATASAAGSKQASAAVVAPVSTIAKAATPEQQRAMDWVKSVEGGPEPVSPLDHPKPLAAPVAVASPQGTVPDTTTTPPPAPKVDPLEGLKLSTTLRTREGGGLAAINGKIYRVGDEVRPGCRLVSIDPSKNRVEISLADGTTAPLGREE